MNYEDILREAEEATNPALKAVKDKLAELEKKVSELQVASGDTLEMSQKMAKNILADIKGKDGTTPVKGKDYPSEDQLKEYISDSLVEKVNELKTNFNTIQSELDEIKAVDHTSGIKAELKSTSDSLSDRLAEIEIGIARIESAELSQENRDLVLADVLSQIPEHPEADKHARELEGLKGDKRLSATALKDTDKLELDAKQIKNLPTPTVNHYSSGGGSSFEAVKEDGVTKKNGVSNINFTGTGVTVTPTVNGVDVAISSSGGAVDSVNGATGTVVLDADDIDDTSTTNKFVTATDVTNLGNLSGTNSGDQNLFSTIAVAGQDNVVADSTSDTLTLVAGTNVTLTTSAAGDSVTIAASGSGGGMEDFLVDADTGDAETVGDGETLTIAGGTGIDTSVAATNTVTVALDSATQSSLGLANSALQSESDPVVGAITGIVKANGAGTISAATSGTDYEVPITFSTGLTRTTNTVTVDTSQNIATLSNLTGNGFVKTSGGTGALSVDTNTYLTTETDPVVGAINGIVKANGAGTISAAVAGTDYMTNPMTTGGDVIYGGASGVPTRLANGSAGQVLTSGGTTAAPTWETPSGAPGGNDGDLQINNSGSFGSLGGLNLGKTGDARGTNALDLQSVRSADTQVASGTQAMAYGVCNTASGDCSSAFGIANTASALRAVAVGRANTASANYAVAVGYSNSAPGTGAVAFGRSNAACCISAAFGYANTTSADRASAFGFCNVTSGAESSSFGRSNTNSGTCGTAVGFTNCVAGARSSAFGALNTATSNDSTAVGVSNIANGFYAWAGGYTSCACATGATALGYGSCALGTASTSIGAINNVHTGEYGTGVGSCNTVDSNYATAVGFTNTASAANASAFGYSNTASATGAVAVGSSNSATTASSVALGSSNSVVAGCGINVGVGYNNTLSGYYGAFCGSSAFGLGNTITANNAHAIGSGVCNTTANSVEIGADDASKIRITTGCAVTLPGALTGVLRADSGLISVDTDVTDIVSAASTSAAGKVELTVASEVTTGDSETLAVTPKALADSTIFGRKSLSVQVFEGATDVTIGDGKAYITIPEALNGMNLVRAQATVVSAGTTNATTVMIHNLTSTADMLSGAISIASGGTVGTVGTISGTEDDVATNDILRIDVDSVSTTAPKGLMVVLEFQLP